MITHEAARQALDILQRYAGPYNAGPLFVPPKPAAKKSEDPLFAQCRKTSRVGDIAFFLRSQGPRMTGQTYAAFLDLLKEAQLDLEKGRTPTAATGRAYVVLTQRHWSEQPDRWETHTRFTAALDPVPEVVLAAWEDEGGAIAPAVLQQAKKATRRPVRRDSAEPSVVVVTTQAARQPRLHIYRYTWPATKTTLAYEDTIEAASEADARARIREKHALKWVPNGATISKAA